jgi:tRNA(His) 5'-end guanylyltransferase
MSLGERQKCYESAYDYEIIKRIPVLIRLDGRRFSKVTKKLQKPFCPRLLWLMTESMKNIAKEIDGAVFGFQQSDEITFITRNDQSLSTEPWFSNRIQKIASISAALMTYEFNELYASMEDPPNLIGQTIFDARVFAVPSINEAINNLIFRQQDCMRNAITSVAYHEFTKKFGKKTALRMLYGKSSAERIDLLQEKCDIDFYSYSQGFRNGVAVYKVPKIFEMEQGPVTRQKWTTDENLPKFAEKREIIFNILEAGRDVFRADRDLKSSDGENNDNH